MTPSEKNIKQAKKLLETLINKKTPPAMIIKLKFIHDCLNNENDLPRYYGKVIMVKNVKN